MSSGPFRSESEWDPAVIAARVGREARPTRSATMSTYRRVGPEKPLSARYTPLRPLRITVIGRSSRSVSSSGASGTVGPSPAQ